MFYSRNGAPPLRPVPDETPRPATKQATVSTPILPLPTPLALIISLVVTVLIIASPAVAWLACGWLLGWAVGLK